MRHSGLLRGKFRRRVGRHPNAFADVDAGGATRSEICHFLMEKTENPSGSFVATKGVYFVSRFPARCPGVAIGFVLLSTAPGKEHEVDHELLNVKEIVELHP